MLPLLDNTLARIRERVGTRALGGKAAAWLRRSTQETFHVKHQESEPGLSQIRFSPPKNHA
ncbi:hypothetical protein FJY63_11250 [Candidatus Sumerlaeota bacterium]|nr:hypothetical protein [Candidatus Sumerlaeota bacterium]